MTIIGQDYTSRRFHFLVSLGRSSRTDKKGKRCYERVRCDCGVETDTKIYSLVHGETKSCGCKQPDLVSTHGHARWRAKSSTYETWSSMVARCTNDKHQAWSRYGGRGITVSQRWLTSFEYFLADMGERPAPGMTLDRIDNDSGYSPENCRWATYRANNNNRRSSRFISAFGETLTLAEWSRRFKINARTISVRLAKGWTAEDAVSVAARQR